MNAKYVDPDQMPQNGASELGLHCLHMPSKWVSSLKRSLVVGAEDIIFTINLRLCASTVESVIF